VNLGKQARLWQEPEPIEAHAEVIVVGYGGGGGLSSAYLRIEPSNETSGDWRGSLCSETMSAATVVLKSRNQM